MLTRTTELCLDEEVMSSGQPLAELHNAVGYLAVWGIGNERHAGKMTIFHLVYPKHGNGWPDELHATYRDKDGNVTFGMMAQRQPNGEFTYHS